MNSAHQLKYFDRILFIDANPNINNEMNYFSHLFDDQIIFFRDVKAAKQEADANLDLKFVIICSSRLIDEIIKIMRPCINCFLKLIVFCGSLGRCDQVMKQYKQVVYRAQCFENKVTQRLCQLQAKLNTIQSKATFKVVWVMKTQAERAKIWNEFGPFIRKLLFELGLPVTFRKKEELEEYLEYSQEMESHLKILVIADDRSKTWHGLYSQLQSAKQKFKNATNWLMLSSDEEKGEDVMEEIFSEVTCIEELECYVESLVDWDTTL